MDKQIILRRIEELCKERNISLNTAFVESGVGKNFKSNLKIANPSMGKLTMLANYFDVTVNYLLGKEEKPSQRGTFISFKSNVREPSNISDIMRCMRNVPVFESVSAGFGASAQDYIVDFYPLYIESDTEAAETLCIRVKGDSMYPKIEDGDLIQVHKQDSVDSGSIAVVLVDNEEGYVKKVLYDTEWIELQSINPLYPPMRFDGPEVLRVRVIGLVRKIIKDI